jgi:hypothetical protein
MSSNLSVLGGLGVVTFIVEKWFVWSGVKKNLKKKEEKND